MKWFQRFMRRKVKKLVRCARCLTTMTLDSIQGSKSCPVCKAECAWHFTPHDIPIVLNWQELRVLANWALHYANQNKITPDEWIALCNTFDKISAFRPYDAPTLLIADEYAEVLKNNPSLYIGPTITSVQ